MIGTMQNTTSGWQPWKVEVQTAKARPGKGKARDTASAGIAALKVTLLESAHFLENCTVGSVDHRRQLQRPKEMANIRERATTGGKEMGRAR